MSAAFPVTVLLFLFDSSALSFLDQRDFVIIMTRWRSVGCFGT